MRSVIRDLAGVVGTSKATGATRDGDAAGDAAAAVPHTRDTGDRRPRHRLTVGVDPARLVQTPTDARQLVGARSVPGETDALTAAT